MEKGLCEGEKSVEKDRKDGGLVAEDLEVGLQVVLEVLKLECGLGLIL